MAAPTSTPRSADRPGVVTWTPGFRGLLGGLSSALAAGAMGLWMATTPQLRALGRGVALDPQGVLILAAIIVALVALVFAWSAFGRAMVVVAGLVLAAHGLLATVMALGGLGVTGRPGAPTTVSVWPIMAVLLGVVGAVIILWGVHHDVTIRRRHLLGSGTATLLAVAAVGVPTIPLSVAGPATMPAMTTAAPFVAQGLVGLLVTLLAMAGFRARRTTALGQAVAAVAVLGADVWWQSLGSSTGALTRDQAVAAVLVAAAVATWALTAGAATVDEDDHLGTWEDDDTWEDDGHPGWPDARAGGREPDVGRSATAVLDPVGDADGRRSRGRERRRRQDTVRVPHDPDPTDPTEVVDPTIVIEP